DVSGFVVWLPSLIRSGGGSVGVAEGRSRSSVPVSAAAIAVVFVPRPSRRHQHRYRSPLLHLPLGRIGFFGSWAGRATDRLLSP
ncbi:MFS transporter, partial [Klebsiella pneumoniae]